MSSFHGQYGGIPGCPGLTLPKSQWQSGLGIGVARRVAFRLERARIYSFWVE